MPLRVKFFGCKLKDYIVEHYYPSNQHFPDSLVFNKFEFTPTITGAIGQDSTIDLVVYAYDVNGNRLNGGIPIQTIKKRGTWFRPNADLHLEDNKVEITKLQLDKVAAGNVISSIELFPEKYERAGKPPDFTKYKVKLIIDVEITWDKMLAAGVNRIMKTEYRYINPSPPADAPENIW